MLSGDSVAWTAEKVHILCRLSFKHSVFVSFSPCVPCRVSLPWWVWPGHPQNAGGQSSGDPQTEVVGWRQMPKGGGPPGKRFILSHPSFSYFEMISHAFFPRPGHGEHWRYLCGAGVRLAGGHFNGSAGVCLDVEADPRKWGETGLSNLYLLCLSVPSLAPTPSWSYEAFQLPALTGEATVPPSVKPERNNQHKAKDVPHIYLRVHIHIFSIYSNRNCINNTHSVVSLNVVYSKWIGFYWVPPISLLIQ